MVLRNIVKIDEEKCDGCGLCAKACAEGAIQIIDGKARLVSEIYCDGLGDCIGHCPQDAITIEQRDAATSGDSRIGRQMTFEDVTIDLQGDIKESKMVNVGG